MTEAEIKNEVDAFVALPRAERRAKYLTLPREVRARARQIIEARRGIAYRNDGTPVFTKEEYVAQIARQTAKLNELPARAEVLKSNINDLKSQLSAHYGDDALAELEAEANQ